MRKILILGGLLAALALPLTAHAGFVIEGSVGKGAKVSPKPVQATQTNLMLAPGYEILWVRLQLGIVGDLPDLKDSKFNLQLRPMFTVSPPILPIYGRLVLAVQNLIGDGETEIAYGPVVGLKFGLFGIGIFAEAGLLPLSVASTMNWVIEGRLGAYWSF